MILSSLLHELGSGPVSGMRGNGVSFHVQYLKLCNCVKFENESGSTSDCGHDLLERINRIMFLNFVLDERSPHEKDLQSSATPENLHDEEWHACKELDTHMEMIWRSLLSHSTPHQSRHMLLEEVQLNASAQASACSRVCASCEMWAAVAAGCTASGMATARPVLRQTGKAAAASIKSIVNNGC